jgi:lipoprotein-anchoring transpeptidase ErfK/SrfK
MSVVVNGAVARTFAVSTGRDKYPTTSGVHVVLDKAPSVIMNSATVGIPKGSPDYYYETVLFDVRISWSGEYVHSAPWSVSSQGRANVSHGCVNAGPADAQWFYNLTRRGDVVVVTGTPRPLQSGNGWTDWNMSWAQWVSGSADNGSVAGPAASLSSAPASATASS